jgi:transposase
VALPQRPIGSASSLEEETELGVFCVILRRRRLARRRRLGLVARISASAGVCTSVSEGAMARVEAVTGPERRRRWTDEQKRAIVAETLEPGAVVAEVARRADIGTGQIYRWRRHIRDRSEGFAQVVIAPAGNPDLQPRADSRCCAAPAIEVDFAGKVHLRISASTPAELAAAVVKVSVSATSGAPPSRLSSSLGT